MQCCLTGRSCFQHKHLIHSTINYSAQHFIEMGFDSADMVQRPTVHKDWAEQQAEAEAEWLHQLWAATLLQASVELEAVRKLQFVIETLTTVPAD